MYDRYCDIKKFVTDPDKLQMENGSEVPISSEENYGIVVDLQGHSEEFERLKPFIVFVAQNLCELDNTAQKFDRLHSKNSQFPYNVEIVFVDEPYIILEYWGTEENTQFDVVFECCSDRFALKSFGTIADIPADWEQRASMESGGKRPQKKGLLRRLVDRL